jgi:hypothetical protein
MFDPKRNADVLYYLGRAVLGSPDGIPTLLVLAYAALAAAQIARAGSSLGASEHIALAATTVCLILVSAGLYSIYLITPYPLAWHVSTSALRLWQQVLPSALFTIFVALPPAENVLGRNLR